MKKHLLKTLLTALVLLTGWGSSAWAEATVIYGRALTADADNGYAAWSTDDVAVSSSDLNVWVGQFNYNETYGLYQKGTGGRSAVMTFAHTANSIQTFDIVFNNLDNTGNANNYSYIKIGSDIEIQSNQQNQTGTVIINGTPNPISDCNKKDYNRGGDSWTIHVEINTAKNKVTALTLVGTPMNGKSASYTMESETALSNAATYNTVTIGFNRAAGSPAAALTSIKIAEEKQAVTSTTYTVNYYYGLSQIKTENGTSTVGTTINAELPITVDGQKYYAADGATTSIELVDNTNVLDVDLRKAYEYAYSINNNFGKVIASGAYVEGEPATRVYWSKYAENEGVWYECEETAYGVDVSGTFNKTVNYNTVSDISYFAECENMNVSRSPAATDEGTANSGGKMVRHYSNSYWYTEALAGGIYSLTIPYKNANSSATTINIYLRDGDGNMSDTEITITGAKQSSGTLTAENIEIPDGYALVLNNTTEWNSNVFMDYIALIKTGDLVNQALATAKEELLAVITYATSIEASELSDAISTAQTAYDATDATVESVGLAKADLVLAVKLYAKGALQPVLELAEEITENSGELAEGIQPYKTELDGAIETAKAALNDEEKTPEEIMTALQILSEKALVFASVTLDAAIAAAKAIDTEGKNEAEALASAITVAEAAIAAENPTIQGFYQAGLDLKQAIDDFNAANYNPNTALLNPSFELSGEETVSTAQGLSNSGGSYYGWTLPNMNSNTSNVSIGNASDCAGNAFGVPTAKDGSFYYFARRGWNNSTSGDATLSTTMTALPVGHYTLTMAYKGLDSWDDSHNSKGSYLKISVVAGETELGATQTKTFEAVKGNSAGANKFTGDANWQDASLEFNVETEGDVTLNIVHHLVGGVRTDVVIDNLVLAYKSFEEAAAEELAAAKEALDAEIEKAEGFKTEARTEGLADYESAINDAKSAQELTSLEDVTQAIADLQSAELSFLTANLPVQTGTYYIYNPLTNKFLARGNAYGTAAVVADYGVAINVEAEVSDETPDGNYSLVGFDNNASYGFDEWMYADAGGNNVRTYTIAKSGDGYTITNTNNSKFVYVYLKEDGNKYRVAGNAIKGENYTDDAQTVWQFISPDAYNDMIAGRIAAEKTAAFAAAEIAEDADVVFGEPVELTFATGHGWTQTVVRTENNQPKTDDNGTEMWQATGYYTQTVSGLPSGLYKVSIQAFYRNGGPDVCVTRYNTGYNTVLAYLDANGSKVQVKSWATDKGDDSDPNSMAQAKAKFNEGKYLSETYAYVGGDGNLNLTVYNPAHIGSGWFIVSNVKYAAVTLPIDPNALATEDDYTALTDAITAVEEKLGFLSGEYAPYNNIEALQLLAAAKSIDKLSDNLQTDVQNATTALTNAKWNVNDAEVNAIFDGSFEHDYSGQTGDINPIGWQRVKGAAADGYNVRLMNGTNAGLAATTSGKALFTKQSAYYGYADGYTMPLKANTIYKISFVYGGWGDCKKDGYVSMTAPDGSAVDVSPADLPVDATNADSDKNSWKPYTALFKTGDAGEYVLGLRKKNYDTSGQSQYVYGDIRIFRATAADFKVQLAAEIAIADDVDVTANVGAAAFQIPASAVTSLSSAISTAQGIYDDADATIDEVLQAVENLKKAEDDYSNAELNAPAANKVYNIVNVTPDYNHAGKAVTFKSSATADLAGNTTSMGWNEEPGSVYPQGVKFTSVEGVKNTYILSYTRADGTDIYVSTGTTSGLGSSTSQIRPTTDAAKALKVRVEASTIDGVWYLWNTEADKRLGANGANDQGFFTGEANGNKYYDMKLQEAVNNEYNLVVDATNQYATLIVPFDATVPAGIIVYSLSNANGNELDLQSVTEIKANTPYVVCAEGGITTTLAGIGAAFTENSYPTGWLTGVYAETAVPNGSYILQNHDGAVAFYRVDTDVATPKVQANHAYMTIPSGDGARAYYFGGEATAIGALKALTSGDAEIYDVNGRKQVKLQKGVNIIRTKDGRTQKVMVK